MTEVTNSENLTMVQAITSALKTMLTLHDDVIVLGEDVGVNGGVFRATDGLIQTFGKERVIDTPLAESGIIGSSIGLAINGFRPVAEIQFLGFIYPGFNQLMAHATRIRSRTLGRFTVPLVIRAPYGAGVHAPEIHSDSVEALFTHMPGIKVVVPSNPYDAKGLLISSIEDPDPVLFMEPMRLYRGARQSVPKEKYTIPLGQASTVKEGDDVTIIAWGAMVPVATQAANDLEKNEGIHGEVLDLRTLYPLDRETISKSVEKTGRVVIIHEAQETGGVGGDILSLINDTETAFLSLKAPIAKVTGFDVPVPVYSLEKNYLPSVKRVKEKIKQVVDY